MNETKERKYWIDLAKGICMLMVLWFHAEMYGLHKQSSSILITPFFMQAFFFFSGYLFLKDIKTFSVKNKLFTSFRVLLFPYIMITAILLFPKMYQHNFGLLDGLLRIIDGRASWFIYVLFIMQLLLSCLFSVNRSIKILYFVLALSLILSFLLTSSNAPIVSTVVFSVLIFSPFFIAGTLYRLHEEKIVKFKERYSSLWKYLLLTNLVLAYVLFLYYEIRLSPLPRNGMYYGCTSYLSYMLLGSIGSLILLLSLNNMEGWNWVRFIGRNTLVYYFFNGLVFTVLFSLFRHLSIPQYLFVVVGLISCVIVLAVLSIFIRRYMPLLIGDKNTYTNICTFLAKRNRLIFK